MNISLSEVTNGVFMLYLELTMSLKLCKYSYFRSRILHSQQVETVACTYRRST